MRSRRDILKAAAHLTAGAATFSPLKSLAADLVSLPFANGARPLVQYPQKRPLLQLTARPPQLETPFSVFDEGVITPNDAFFVRYHLANLPLNLDPARFALEIKGHVQRPQRFSLDALRRLEPSELVAVNQCSGNSRGFFEPRVGGGQLGHGAMGNARWRGVSLRRLLDIAGVQAGARQVVFNGLDRSVIDKTPDFEKALDIDHARDGEVMVAYAMNGEDLPVLNGFPLRLVVPGHFGTYWVKHLSEVTVLDRVFDGYWMQAAYRIPDNDCACVAPGAAVQTTTPITRFAVRSFITNVMDGGTLAAGRDVLLKGIAFDGGSGIRSVEVSRDGGRSWQQAQLGQDLGRYSFREWRVTMPLAAGAHLLKVRATSNSGETQPDTARWNPAGYLRNVIESVRVTAA
jgi:DMSO/TMAO reductase YedYZ molybdopterin-dependent catalytic subunit